MTQHPGKLHHGIPPWVARGAFFHVRIRRHASSRQDWTSPPTVSRFIESAVFYHRQHSWYARIFLVMPDHLHAILAFPSEAGMSRVVGAWKSFLSKACAAQFQDNYFDHRLRNDEELATKAQYIRMNPVVQGLCDRPEDWKWVVEPCKDDP